MPRPRFTDEDALAWQQGPKDSAPVTGHVHKHLQRRKGLEISFDEKGHKDWVSGFKRRKDKRRKLALKQVEQKEKRLKQEEKAQKLAKLREELQLDRYETASEDEDTAAVQTAAEGSTVQVLQAPHGPAAVVTIAPLSMHSDSDGEQPAAQSLKEKHQPQQQQQRQPTVPRSGKAGQQQARRLRSTTVSSQGAQRRGKKKHKA